MSTNTSSVRIKFIEKDFDIAKLDDPAWNSAEPVEVGTYWSGEQAPAVRRFTAQLLWSRSAIYVRFTSVQNEPVIVAEKPDLSKKSIGLWDRDVNEIFIAPNPAEPNKYFEFEVAPNGEWLDVGLTVLPDKRVSDWDYASRMTSAARIEKERIVSAIKIDWKAFGKTPSVGDTWRGNLFRCVGKDPNRGYLAWQPTLTDQPSFHVPDKFGNFVFVK